MSNLSNLDGWRKASAWALQHTKRRSPCAGTRQQNPKDATRNHERQAMTAHLRCLGFCSLKAVKLCKTPIAPTTNSA